MKKLIKSFGYAFEGIGYMINTEMNARIHLFVIVIVSSLGFYFQISKQDWINLVFCFGLVVSMEALNTAIERLTDLVTIDKHPLAKRAKDLGAAAVTITALSALVNGVIIFYPYLKYLFY